MGAPKLAGKNWTVAQIEEMKGLIKAELDAIGSEPGVRVEYALGQIKLLEQDLGDEAQLRCFILIISILVQQQRHGLVSANQIDRLVTTAYAILQLRSIKPGISRQAFLFGELHQAKSLIYRRDGDHWRAAWEQQLAEHLSHPYPLGGAGYQFLSLGTRAMRMGDAAAAYAHFCKAREQEISQSNHQLVIIGMVRALRLAGKLVPADALIDRSQKGELAKAVERELAWEKLCIEVARDGDLSGMLLAVRKNKSHYQASYIVEAFLWAFAQKKKAWQERIVKMRTLARNKTIKPKQQGMFFQAACVIEQCYDIEIPLVLRLKKLGDMLSQVQSMINIDKELLVQAAAARWLVRIHSFALARHVLRQYEVTSIKLSDGAERDVLGLAADMQEADWYAEKRWSELNV